MMNYWFRTAKVINWNPSQSYRSYCMYSAVARILILGVDNCENMLISEYNPVELVIRRNDRLVYCRLVNLLFRPLKHVRKSINRHPIGVLIDTRSVSHMKIWYIFKYVDSQSELEILYLHSSSSFDYQMFLAFILQFGLPKPESLA